MPTGANAFASRGTFHLLDLIHTIVIQQSSTVVNRSMQSKTQAGHMLRREPLDGAEKRRHKVASGDARRGSRSPTPRSPLSATFVRRPPSRRSHGSRPQHVSSLYFDF